MLLGIRDDCVTGTDLESKMHTLKQLGCDFVELVVDPNMLDELSGSEAGGKYHPKKALRQLNLAVANTGLPVLSVSFGGFSPYAQKTVEERAEVRCQLYQCINLASAVGAGTVLIATCEFDQDFADVAALFKAELQDVLDLALEKNVRMCFEPVWKCPTAYVTMLVRAIEHPAAYVYFDMGNCLHFGEDPIAALLDCIAHVGALHIKPAPGKDMLLGEMPLTGILNILKDGAFSGVGVLEMDGGEDNKILRDALEILEKLDYRR